MSPELIEHLCSAFSVEQVEQSRREIARGEYVTLDQLISQDEE